MVFIFIFAAAATGVRAQSEPPVRGDTIKTNYMPTYKEGSIKLKDGTVIKEAHPVRVMVVIPVDFELDGVPKPKYRGRI